MMAVAIARDVRDGEMVGIGVNSPIPTAGVLLASRMHAPRVRFRIDGHPGGIAFLGSKEFFDFAQRGRLDLFFLSGIQIDAHANINLHVLGEHDRPQRRFPGAFGSAVLYHVVKRVILFRTEHSRRTFVPKVDFVTASGETPAGQERRGGPHLVVTPLAVLAFNHASGMLELASFHPGQTPESVQDVTGFELRPGPDLRETPAPSAEELELLRGPVYQELARTHPAFVAAQRSLV